MKKNNIYKTTVFIVVLEIIIKIMGFIKQAIIANYFGAGKEMDAYFVASDFINGFSNSIINSAKIGIIAIYTSVRIKEGEKKGNLLINELLEILLPIIFIVSIFFDFFSFPISKILAPKFELGQLEQLSKYISFFSWMIILSVLCMVFESIISSYEIYFFSKLRSFIYSFLIIIGSVLFSDKYGISVLLYIQYLTLIVYLIMQIFRIRKKFYFQFSVIKSKSELMAIICMMLPALVGNSMIQINYWVDNAVASSLPQGAVSALSYSHVLDDLFVGVFITTVASVILPHFSNLLANNNSEEIKRTLNNGLCFMIIILIPISMIAFFCSTEIVEFAFFRGKFAQETVKITSLALKGYVLRYPFVAIRDLSIQSLYTYKNTKLPMRNAIICTFINIIVSVICSKYWGIIAISFGTTISAIIGAILNALSLKKVFIQFDFSNIFDIYKKSIVPIVILWFIFYFAKFDVNTGTKILDIIVISIIVCGIYICSLLMFGQKTVLSIGKKMIGLYLRIFKKN